MDEGENMQIQYNRTVRVEKPRYIVIHTTGNPRRGADARAHFDYWNGQNVGQSADFVVDDKEVLQINDYNKYYTWHCGDGKGRYGISNSNSIGIEICVNADGDFEKALNNAVELVQRLKAETGITEVVRHYDASRKLCPAELSKDNWNEWYNFLDRANHPKAQELTSINDIVWELSQRELANGGKVICDVELWMQKLNGDVNVYWLARKIVQYLREKRV